MKRALVFLLVGALTILVVPARGHAALNEAIKHNNFGADLLKQGRLDEAIVELLHAVEVDPTYAAAYLNLAYAYDQQGKAEEAIEAYKKGVSLDPKSLYGFNNLGVLYNQLGRYDEAITAFQEALQIDPSNETVLKNLESAKKNKGLTQDRETRIAEARKQVEAKPNDPEAAYNLARVYASFGEKDQAFEWLSKARILGYNNLEFIKADPALATLRDDPRFQAILTRK